MYIIACMYICVENLGGMKKIVETNMLLKLGVKGLGSQVFLPNPLPPSAQKHPRP